MSSEQNNNEGTELENTLVINNDNNVIDNSGTTIDTSFNEISSNDIADITPTPANSRRSSRTSTLSGQPPAAISTLARRITVADSRDDIDWFAQREYIMFKNELTSQRKINNFILKECKENKRLLDLKCNDLTKTVNNIQTSVIFVSTLSGYLQATKIQFGIPSDIIEVFSISISTYIALILSISKYYKLD